MSEFRVGDRVEIVDKGRNYSDSKGIAGELGLSNYVRGYKPNNGMFGKVVSIYILGLCSHRFIGVSLENGVDVVIAEEGIRVIEDTSKYHKHHDLIIAWAKGEIIQFRFQYQPEWRDFLSRSAPTWVEDTQYRVKPTNPNVDKIKSLEDKAIDIAQQLKELREEM